MSILEVAKVELTLVSEDASLFEVAESMKENNVGSVIVVKDKNTDLTPIGILTDRDMVTQFFSYGIDPKMVSAKDMITKELVYVKISSSINEVLQAMQQNAVRRIPIVDLHNKVIALLSLDDLLLYFSKKFQALAEIVKRQVN